jgi:hypothetical protein
VAYVAGMALGGVLTLLGPEVAIALDGATFVVSAMLVATLPRMAAPDRPRATRGLLVSFASELAEAVAFARARPPLLRAVLSKTPIAIAGGAGWLTLNLVASDLRPLGSAAISLGVMQAVRGAGTGLGPTLAHALSGRGVQRAHLAITASAIAFSGMAVFASAHALPLLLLAALAWGSGSGANWVLSQASLQKRAGDRFIGRLAAIDELSVTAFMCLTAAMNAWVVTKTGSTTVPTLAFIVLGISAWLGLHAGARRHRSASAWT